MGCNQSAVQGGYGYLKKFKFGETPPPSRPGTAVLNQSQLSAKKMPPDPLTNPHVCTLVPKGRAEYRRLISATPSVAWTENHPGLTRDRDSSARSVSPLSVTLASPTSPDPSHVQFSVVQGISHRSSFETSFSHGTPCSDQTQDDGFTRDYEDSGGETQEPYHLGCSPETDRNRP
mmetsp:Transcript_133764/g.232053  ORF Transcript_133764/g.232053 Transcript_133764/m.232053 type:complete len:175 (-) Transcript_133764:485-1009(-)